MLLPVVGCTDPATRTYPVSGSVTLDGQPIESGSITFESADGGAGVFSEAIRNGQYQLRSTAGMKKVSISAYRPRGDQQTATPDRENYIPARYNAQTTLTVEIKRDGDNQHDFSLKTR
jgi:hypothetical protein